MTQSNGGSGSTIDVLRANLAATPEVAADLAKGGEVLDDACLRRWLRADKDSVEKAEKRLRAHARWRAEYVPTGRIEESELPHELAQRKTFMAGTNKQGQPCMFVKGARHDAKGRDLEQCKRCICYTLDRAAEQATSPLNPDAQLSIVFDLRGLGVKNIDRKVLSAVFDVLQNHYPERMGALWFYDAPSIFWGLWKVVGPFIDPGTAKKVKFVNASANKELQAEFDPKELVAELGGKGTAKLIPIEEFAASYRQRPAAAPAATLQNGAAATPVAA